MNIDSNQPSGDDEAAKLFKPINDLLAKEADELKKVDEMIDDVERKAAKLFPPAKRDDED